MDAAQLLDLTLDLLPADGRFTVDDPAVVAALADAAPAVTAGPPGTIGDELADAVLLLSGEVATAGERGPAVIDAAVQRCRPGGSVVVAVASRVHGTLTSAAPPRATPPPGMTAAEVAHALSERGLEVRRLVAPGAAARLAARPWRGRADLEVDATPGLLDAGPVILAVARTPRTEAERSRTFFSSIARKIVSASGLCLTTDRRLLVVHDSFKQAWTLPGGLVDADENPADAAVREVHEEGGVDVQVGKLLGIFAHSIPDRINLVYGATPVDPPAHPVPVHTHEIAEARWVPLDEARDVLDGSWPRKVACCLDQPGRTWQW